MARNHIVLVGSQDPVAGATTVGTGFLVSVGQRCWAVTCRHVIREAARGSLFALPKPKRTKNPSGGYFVLALAPPKYHPADDGVATYDVAVAEVITCDTAALLVRDIAPVNLTGESTPFDLEEGRHLKALGYPISYANEALAANSDAPLRPKEIEGTIRSIPWPLAMQHGFSFALREVFFAQTSRNDAGGKGMSGAIVSTVDGNTTVGMVLGHGDFQYTTKGGVAETLADYVFAHVSRIRETLGLSTEGWPSLTK